MYQKITIVGYLGGDPEMRFTPKGDAVTNFSVATSRKYSGTDETTWFSVSVWGNQAEPCKEYLAKGSLVLVEGRIKPNSDGNPRVFELRNGSFGSSYDVVASDVKFLSRLDTPAPAF